MELYKNHLSICNLAMCYHGASTEGLASVRFRAILHDVAKPEPVAKLSDVVPLEDAMPTPSNVQLIVVEIDHHAQFTSVTVLVAVCHETILTRDKGIGSRRTVTHLSIRSQFRTTRVLRRLLVRGLSPRLTPKLGAKDLFWLRVRTAPRRKGA